jgi:hypothetical protein
MTPPSRSASERNRTLGLDFTISQRSAKPGDVVQFPLFLSNNSSHPWKCRYDLEADKQLQHAWTVVAPDAVGPAQRRQGHLEIRVPKGGRLQPGTYHLSLQAIPNDSSEPAVAEAVLVVEAKRCVFLPSVPKFDLQPDGSVIATLSLGNCGNIDCKASIQIRHKEGWKFEIDSPELTVKSGIKGVNAKLTLRPPSGKSARPGDEVTLDISWQGQTLLVQPLKGHIKVEFGPPPVVRKAIVVGTAVVALVGGLGIWAATRTPRDSDSGLTGRPAVLDFGARAVGDASEPIEFTATNGGAEELTIDRIRLTGTGRSDFSLGPNKCEGAALRSRGSCIVVVRFTPRGAGNRNAELVIGRNGREPLLATALVGTGTAGRLMPVPTQVRFAGQAVTTRSPAQAVTVANHGTAPIVIARTGLAGANPADFVRTRDRCSTATLAPTQTCLVEVAFAPAVDGGRSATLTIEGDGGGTFASVALSGQATATGQQRADLQVDTPLLDFQEQRLRTASGPQTLRVRNNATERSRLERVTLTGADSGDFTRPRDTCSGRTVASFDLCSVDVVFTPGGVGGRSATLTVPGSDPARPLTVALTGTGTEPTLDVSRGSLDFPGQQIGATGAQKSVTLTNSGTAVASISVTGPSGANSNDFAVDQGCSRNLAAGTSCAIRVSFKPTAVGIRRATLTITHDALGSPGLISLTGSATEAEKPDLTVAINRPSLRMRCSPSPNDAPSGGGDAPSPSCVTSFEYSVSNRGSGDVVGPFDVTPTASGEPGDSYTVTAEGLKAGQRRTDLATLKASCYQPNCTVTVTIDGNNVVAESYENNNADTYTDIPPEIN